jgi:hypothetical protein
VRTSFSNRRRIDANLTSPPVRPIPVIYLGTRHTAHQGPARPSRNGMGGKDSGIRSQDSGRTTENVHEKHNFQKFVAGKTRRGQPQPKSEKPRMEHRGSRMCSGDRRESMSPWASAHGASGSGKPEPRRGQGAKNLLGNRRTSSSVVSSFFRGRSTGAASLRLWPRRAVSVTPCWRTCARYNTCRTFVARRATAAFAVFSHSGRIHVKRDSPVFCQSPKSPCRRSDEAIQTETP